MLKYSRLQETVEVAGEKYLVLNFIAKALVITPILYEVVKFMNGLNDDSSDKMPTVSKSEGDDNLSLCRTPTS
jgi:hypothetical protein